MKSGEIIFAAGVIGALLAVVYFGSTRKAISKPKPAPTGVPNAVESTLAPGQIPVQTEAAYNVQPTEHAPAMGSDENQAGGQEVLLTQ